MATRLWKFLNTDIREFFSAETAKTGTESAKAVMDLAKVLKEQGPKNANLAPYVQQISSLLDVLNSPLAQVVGSALPFVNIATSLLKLYTDLTKEEPTLEKSVALVSQAAYLESFKAILGLPENQELLQRIGNTPASGEVEQQIRKLADLELDEREAKQTVTSFHTSKLAQAFGDVLKARLQRAGLTETEAKRLSDRVAWDTHRYMNQALADAGDSVKPLAELYRNGGREVLEKYQSLDSYLEEQIKPKPLEPVFAESFTFRDLYVPLNAQPIGKDGSPDETQQPVELEQWAKDLLNDDTRKDRVMFIQGGPGRGKSVFCRMFADWVRQHEYPRWTPILIRLRDLRSLEKDFEETLRKAVDRDFAKNDPGWLTDRNIRFLFLLDGFDELLMEGRTSGGLQDFLKQVGRFQESCAVNSEKGHRVLITGRTLSLQSIERLMPPNLERMEMLAMNDALQNRWLGQWEKLVGIEKTSSFQQFLQDKHCPERVRELAREPLLLYLLAAMHRDGELQPEIFEGNGEITAKNLIYSRTLDWVLTKQRPEWLNRDLTEIETEGLQHILAEAGLCVVQAGGEHAPIKMIEARLKNDHIAKSLLDEARTRLGDNPLRNALAAFYLQPGKGGDGSVEFAHKSFGEFLYASRLKESLSEWALPGLKRQEFYISTEQMDWEIYDLLGFGSLTPEIVEYLMLFLDACPEMFNTEKVLRLFKRLESFYFRWADGEFIDTSPPTLPQRKMSLLKEQLSDRNTPVGQRQIDVYAGLNIMILLFGLHRYGQVHNDLKEQIHFHPCGRKDTDDFYDSLLRRIIQYSYSTRHMRFRGIVGPLLMGSDLSNTSLFIMSLSEINLSQANLQNASLWNSDLRKTNLSGANLSNGKLFKVNLNNANLVGTNLSSSQLNNATLAEADLSGANLSDADLKYANLEGANLQNIIWNENTIWEGVRGLETAVNVPDGLKQQLELKNE